MSLLLVLLHLSLHVVDEGYAVNPSCTCIRFTSTLGAERGTFSSPDYPRAYPARLPCLLYTFLASPHQIIEIVFNDFDVYKEHQDCRKGDHLKVYWEVQGPGPPGINERSAWSREFCGGKADIPSAIYSPGPVMVMEFHSGVTQRNSSGFIGTFSFIDKHIVMAHRLRTGHIPLRRFAFMMKVDDPYCEECGGGPERVVEDVQHFLVEMCSEQRD